MGHRPVGGPRHRRHQRVRHRRGSLLILYLTAFAGMDQYTAGGLNLLYFLFCAPAALISHIKNKLVDWKTVLFCTVTGVVTSVGAAFAAAAIDVSLLRRLFGVLLLYIGVKELFCKSSKKEKEGRGRARRPQPAKTANKTVR